MAMTDLSTVVLSKTIISIGGTFPWMSPELLFPLRIGSDGCPTRESDCYALAMVIYEVSWVHSLRWLLTYQSQVLTGLQPFHHMFAYTVVSAVLRGERPEKPLDAESLGFSDALWELIELCWSESISVRPTAQMLLDFLSSASLTWVPPSVYPSIAIDTLSITYSDSSDSLRTSPTSSTCEM